MAKLEARVKQDYFLAHISAFSGLEFVKSEWRPVPAGLEDQARNHELLEVREVKTKTPAPEAHYVAPPVPIAPPEFDTEEAEAPEPDKPRRPRRRKATEEEE